VGHHLVRQDVVVGQRRGEALLVVGLQDAEQAAGVLLGWGGYDV